MFSRNASAPGKQRRSRGSATGNTKDRLLKEAKEIRNLWDAADNSDLRARYALAVKCRKVCEDTMYGEGAAAYLAKLIGRTRKTVYDYAKVAERWPTAKAFAGVIKCRSNEDPLTWSHYVELAKEDDTERRQTLLAVARKNSWTVQQLIAVRQQSEPESAGDTVFSDSASIDSVSDVFASISDTMNTAASPREALAKANAKQPLDGGRALAAWCDDTHEWMVVFKAKMDMLQYLFELRNRRREERSERPGTA